MESLKQLKEALEVKEARFAELNGFLATRSLTATEEAEVDTLMDEIGETNKKIERETRRQQLLADQAHAQARKGNPEQQLKKEFSLFRAIDLHISNKPLDGAELDVHEAGMQVARNGGMPISGIALPDFIFNQRQVQSRAQTAAVAATAANLIPTDLAAFLPALYPKLMLEKMGATMLTGLTGNIDIPIGNALAEATFNTETGSADETDPTTRKISLSPHRLAAFTNVTKQLLIQGRSVEAWIMTELFRAEARKVEEVAILGGGSNEPNGILDNTLLSASANNVSFGGTGGAITRAKLLEMERVIADSYADEENMRFLSNPAVRQSAKGTLLDAGSGKFLWEDGINQLIGYPAFTSTLVPNDLTTGGGGSDLSAIIFGNFQRLMIANWGVRDLTVDIYTKAKVGSIELILNSFWDVNLTHHQAFSVVKDVVTEQAVSS